MYSLRHRSRQLSNATSKGVEELYRRLILSLTRLSLKRLVSISNDESLNSSVEEIGIMEAGCPTTVKEDALVKTELVAALSQLPKYKQVVVIDSRTYTSVDLDAPLVLARRCTVPSDRFGADLNMFRKAISMMSTTVDSLAYTLREFAAARPVLACLKKLDITIVMGHQELRIMPYILIMATSQRHLSINLPGPSRVSNGLGDMFVHQ